MSDVFQSSELDHLDPNTKLMINGFIRASTVSITREIPETINYVVLKMVDDHFMMNRGSYQWKITSAQQIQRILSAQTDFHFNSNVFEMCGLQWIMKLYPNGNTAGTVVAGEVGLFVRLLMFPCNWESILIQATITCHETNTVSHHIVRYKSDSTC